MAEGIRYAHERGVKVYVTANILAHNSDLAGAEQYFGQLAEMKPDAILVADPGMFMLAKRACPEIPLHISTQANNTNYETFNFWFNLGAERVVCARELSLVEIAQIRKHIPEDREIEWKYAVMEESRPGVYLPIEENERGTFVFNSRDLCMIEHIPDLLRAGVDSLKIEGRMKTALYVASVARAYRQALDDCSRSEELYQSRIPEYQDAIRKCTYRRFTTGFY